MNGVTTRVKVEAATRLHYEIRIDGVTTTSAVVSEHVLKSLLRRTKGNYNVIIEHELEVPIGAGFGSSGGGALSLALALNEALGIGLSRIEVAQVAHISEVECKTGLGTVVGEAHGGFGVRVKPGGPGIGVIRWLPLPEDYVVAGMSFGPLSTRDVLTNENLRRKINAAGGILVDRLTEKPSPEYFMEFSREFTEHVGLTSERMRKVLTETDASGLPCTMAMLGESLFSLAEREVAEDVLQVFRRHVSEKGFCQISKVDHRGARIIEE